VRLDDLVADANQLAPNIVSGHDLAGRHGSKD
jgi:hypothetical protein